jgi:hypothetical protein
MKKLFYLILLLCIGVHVHAQNKVVVESIRSYSMFGPTMYYLQDQTIQAGLTAKLKTLLSNYYNLTLVEEALPIQIYYTPDALKNNNASFRTSDTSSWHLFIELYEYDPSTFMAGSMNQLEDTTIINKSKSVFQISILLANGQKQIINDQNIFAAITTTESSGGGVSPKNIFLTKKSFGSLVQVGLQMALDSSNLTEVVEIKAPPVYYADNFILKHLKNATKIEVKENKSVWQFNIDDNPEVLRMGEQLYDEIWVKRKLIDSSASPLLLSKMKETGNTASSDFIYLRQECRDVYQDKNYTIKLATEIDPFSQATSKKQIFTNFLPGLVNMMLLGKDTVAVFAIFKNVGDPVKQIYLDKTTNGIDSSSTASVSDEAYTFKVNYDYQMTGKIKGNQFTIFNFWNNEMKELYLNNQLICIVKGKTDPENFILINGYNNPTMIKELLLIAYNKFLL